MSQGEIQALMQSQPYSQKSFSSNLAHINYDVHLRQIRDKYNKGKQQTRLFNFNGINSPELDHSLKSEFYM